MAEALDVSRQSISKWEQGTAQPSIENLTGLGQLYGVSIDTLINKEIPAQCPPQAGCVQETALEARQDGAKRKSRWALALLCVFIAGVVIGALLTIWEVGKPEKPIPIKELDREVVTIDEEFTMKP